MRDKLLQIRNLCIIIIWLFAAASIIAFSPSLIIMAFPSSLYGESLSAKDFAYGFTLNLSGNGAIYRVELPDELYKGVVRQDLGDIRIFNANSEIVPHFLRSSESLYHDRTLDEEQTIEKQQSEDQTTKISAKTNLPFFPLYDQHHGDRNGDISMSIVQSADGTIIRVESSREPNSSEKTDSSPRQESQMQSDGAVAGEKSKDRKKLWKNITGYILDMSRIKPYPPELELEWRGGSDHFVINVTLQGSDDLTYWDHITEKSIAKLQFAGDSIYENHLPLTDSEAQNRGVKEQRRYRYLRLSWPAEEQISTSGALLSKIAAVFPKPAKIRARERRELANGRFSPTSRMEINFDSQGFFPVDAVQIKFNQSNSIIRATVESSPDGSSMWTQRCEGVFYTLRAGGSEAAGISSGKSLSSELTNGPFTFPPTCDRFWRIRVSQDGAGLSGALYPPLLEIGFRPHELLFVARGNPPYTLAYGRGRDLKNSWAESIPDLILKAVNKDDIEEATLGAATVLGGEAQLKSAPSPLPWKRWILWASLIGGVALIAFMVWSLARQMRSRD